MKKIISIVLVAALLVCFTATALAESAVGYTPRDVLQWLEENDEFAKDATEQSVNASHRLAEMLVYIDSLNADEEALETLQDILNAVKEAGNSEDLSPFQSLATGSVQIARALVVLANESDPNGVYGDTLQGLIDDYNAGNDAVDSADGQTVVALFAAVRLAALVVKESCTSQDQIDQIDAGLAELDAENEAAGDMYDQMAAAAKWLRKMLGAFAKLHNPGCVDDINAELENTENHIASEDMGPKQVTFQYLCSSIYAMAIFTGDLSMD